MAVIEFSNCLYLAVALTDPPETLPTAWNAGLIEIGGVMGDFTKSEVQQR